MKLIIDLGNPEYKHASTRHNIGFWTVDQYVAQHGSHFVVKSRFKSLVAELPTETGADKIVVVNASGRGEKDLFITMRHFQEESLKSYAEHLLSTR